MVLCLLFSLILAPPTGVGGLLSSGSSLLADLSGLRENGSERISVSCNVFFSSSALCQRDHLLGILSPPLSKVSLHSVQIP